MTTTTAYRCWHGDWAEYTGNSRKLYGAQFYELRLLAGHRKGQLVWTQREPDGAVLTPTTHSPLRTKS